MEAAPKELEKGLETVLEGFKRELAGIRANRPSPKLIEDIKVDYLGERLAVKQLASVSVVPPREIKVSAWDKQVLPIIVKAIETANLGFSVSIDGNLIRIGLPVLTAERRQELTKAVKAIAERERIKIRILRDDCRKKTKELKDEDERYKTQERIQKAVDKINDEIGKLSEMKIREIND